MTVINFHGSPNHSHEVQNLCREVATNIGIKQDLINQTAISIFLGTNFHVDCQIGIRWPITHCSSLIDQRSSIANFDQNHINQFIDTIPNSTDEIIETIEEFTKDELSTHFSNTLLVENFALPKKCLQGIIAHEWAHVQNDTDFPIYEFGLRYVQLLSIICLIGAILGAYFFPILLTVVPIALTVSVILQKLIADNWQEKEKTADLLTAKIEDYRIGIRDYLKLGYFLDALADKMETGTARPSDDLYFKAKQWIFQNFFATHPSYSERIAYLSRPVA